MARSRASLATASLMICSGAFAADLVIGPAYPIAEVDTAQELHERAAKADWQSLLRQDPKQDAAFNSDPLPRAKVTRQRMFDPTYTLPRDIVDRSGKVLYAAGYRFNIYERLQLKSRYIVIGPAPEDFEWLSTVARPQPGDKVLLAGGNILDERARYKARLFLLDQRFVERFGIQVIPSIVQQRGKHLQISEYALEARK